MSPSLPLPCDPQDNVSGSLHGNTKMTHFRYVNERHILSSSLLPWTLRLFRPLALHSLALGHLNAPWLECWHQDP